MVFYTCREIAERYKVEVGTVWAWVRAGILPAIKLGKEYRVAEDDLKEFESARKLNVANW